VIPYTATFFVYFGVSCLTHVATLNWCSFVQKGLKDKLLEARKINDPLNGMIRHVWSETLIVYFINSGVMLGMVVGALSGYFNDKNTSKNGAHFL
jgi:hypothetical protein